MSFSKIVDFTSIIEEEPNTYNFNPSIAHWKEDLYLCCYRNFIRYKNVNNSEYKEDPLFDPNHPWLGGDNSTTWWKFLDGDDKTGFFIMSKKDFTVKNVKSLNDGNSIYTVDKNLIVNKTNLKKLDGVDARLLHLTKNHFLISYNRYVKNPLQIKNRTCEDGCFILIARIIKLDSDGNMYMYDENVVCPSISNQIEKNWSFWVYNNQVFFSYGLAPYHSMYNAQINLTNGTIACFPSPITEKVGYYGYLERIYNSNISEKILFISVTTPSIPKRDDIKNYIGVGHVKYKNDSRLINLIQKTPLGFFFNKTKNFKRHPIYDYLMFVYEFDPDTGAIVKITDMFIPRETEYILAFPSGLEYTPSGDLMISYGDHDSLSKLLIIKKNIINKLLKPIQTDSNNLIISPLPDEVNFFSFPTECIDKTGLCSLLLS